ncbi:hypothetical protein BBF96_07365 [Anoxybacter fermentans]|uniref:Uncharacterized protein n=1 Tax=Anoxybacter fermentans TaxID=1323375 RepID=A0A3S9SY15_9FIRM|nr:hypothetical protein [Anoxybacter fermentans]AZR73217.1 hypothetical protein BBF96_07365 [Anoxybacter fermentans]
MKINKEDWLEIPLNKESHDCWNNLFFKSLASQVVGLAANLGVARFTLNGLYTATVNPASLIKYSNGTLGSIVRGQRGLFEAHAGFKPAGSAVLAPILMFQVMSIITGQYYLHGINKQLNIINEKLDELIRLNHVERSAKIKACIHVLRDLSKRKTANIEDMIQLKQAMFELKVIHE